MNRPVLSFSTQSIKKEQKNYIGKNIGLVLKFDSGCDHSLPWQNLSQVETWKTKKKEFFKFQILEPDKF